MGSSSTDGTPTDGARTEYVNGLDATIRVARHATIEAIAAWDPTHDTYLPVLRDQHRTLIEWEERLAGVYFTSAPRPDLQWQAYYVFKREIHDTRPATNPQFQPDRSLSTFGGRVEKAGGTAWTMSGEWAMQSAPRCRTRRFVRGAGWPAYSAVSPRRGRRPSAQRARRCPEALPPRLSSRDGTRCWRDGRSGAKRFTRLSLRRSVWRTGRTWGCSKQNVLVTPSPRIGVRATYYHLTAFHPFPGTPLIFGVRDDPRRPSRGEVRFLVRRPPPGTRALPAIPPGVVLCRPYAGYCFASNSSPRSSTAGDGRDNRIGVGGRMDAGSTRRIHEDSVA